MLEYSGSVVDDCLVLTLNGRLTMGSTCQKLGVKLRGLNGRSNIRVLLDLEGVEGADTSDIGVLLVWNNLVEGIGGALAFQLARDSKLDRDLQSNQVVSRALRIFYDRQSALDFLQSCHLSEADLGDHLAHHLGGPRFFPLERLLDEIARHYTTFYHALGMLERAALQASNDGAANALTRGLMRRRLSLSIDRMHRHYERAEETGDKTALVADRGANGAADLIAEAMLQHKGWSVYNAFGVPGELSVIGGMADSLGIQCAVVCESPKTDAGRVKEHLEALKRTLAPPMMAVYQPGAPTENPLTQDLGGVRACSSIKGLSNHLSLV